MSTEEQVKCVCGNEFMVIFASCGHVNCPNCGMLLKVGACDG